MTPRPTCTRNPFRKTTAPKTLTGPILATYVNNHKHIVTYYYRQFITKYNPLKLNIPVRSWQRQTTINTLSHMQPKTKPFLSDLGKVLEVPLREDSVVVDVQAGPLPVGHGGTEKAAVSVLPRVEHNAHRASSSVVGVLHKLAQDAAQHR